MNLLRTKRILVVDLAVLIDEYLLKDTAKNTLLQLMFVIAKYLPNKQGIFNATVGFTLFLESFKNFTITTASILNSVQPVYGFIIGAIFLAEFPTWTTMLGGTRILTAVIIESVRTYRYWVIECSVVN